MLLLLRSRLTFIPSVDFVPLRVFEVKFDTNIAFGLEFHGLAPEFSFDPEVLPPGPALRLRVARGYGRVVGDLLRDVFEAFVVSDTLVSFS